ncbi:MAG: hypothetical protein P1U32_08595 [Legionellaceae bacterium]|nr:hypothetical protein [Legionellaceae bacterium]
MADSTSLILNSLDALDTKASSVQRTSEHEKMTAEENTPANTLEVTQALTDMPSLVAGCMPTSESKKEEKPGS